MKAFQCFVLLCCAFATTALAAVSRPNVLLICVDDLKPLLGCYGDRRVQSPNIDRLAKRGVLFERAYCNQAVCAPSRNALLTGVRPTRSGIYDLGTNFRAAHPDAVTFPQYFLRHGYRTEALGKIFHVGHGNHEDPASWSVPHWKENSIAYALPESRAREGLTREEALFSNRPAGNLPRGAAYEAAEVPDNGYPDGRIADEAIRRLRGAKARPSEPFFLAVGFLKPHLPFCAPKKYWDLYDRASFEIPARRAAPDSAPKFAPSNWGELRQYGDMPANGPVTDDQARALIHGYHAALSYMDAQLGRLLDEFDRLDFATNTMVVLWGDHGWHLGDHGWWSKHSNYEEAARIPLIIVAPGVSRPGTRAANAFVETVDLFPTLAELAGLPVPDVPQGIDGKSIAPILRRPGRGGNDHAFHTFPRGERIGRAVRTERHRLVEWKVPGAAADTAILELYDYKSDPGETRNLADNQPQVAARLRKLLAALPEARPQIKAGPHPANSTSGNGVSRTNAAVRFDPVARDIEGWTVHVEPALLEGEHREEGARALTMLANHLQRIKILVPSEPLKKMQALEIWIEHDHPRLKSMQYHPSRDWLVNNGHDTRLAKKVHITQARELLSRGQMLKHPAVVLHELAHAYHDQVLDFDHPEIIEVFKQAKAAGSYEKVLLYTGEKVRHYALTDHKEYFAEGTEAYFYRNDFYPFVRVELKEHDPAFHDLLAKIWGPAR